jgi:ubiquinone/menaquinone biosynthesis C-methylase UbiE
MTATHSDLAALRGEPSYVWRDGQERRLHMVARWAKVHGATILDHGCGVGMYAAEFQKRFTRHVEAFEYEFDRVREAQAIIPHAIAAAAESLPYPDNTFDTLFSNEVIEHVADDVLAAREIIRVLKVGGRAVIFCPNRWYPFETHGYYWRGEYHFGNTPLINYLPDKFRNQLAPHVRTYTEVGLLRLFNGLPVQIVHHSRVYGGYDNIVRRFGTAGRILRQMLQSLEGTKLDALGLSHLLVVEKT